MVCELGRERVRGHEKVEIEGDEVFHDEGAGFENEQDDKIEERDAFVEEPLSDKDSFVSLAPPELGRGAGRYGASRWRRVEQFFDDLRDYWIEKKSVTKQEFWRKVEQWEFEGKVIQKNGSYLRFKPYSRDEAV